MSIFISAFVKYFLSQTLMFRIYSVLKKFTNRMLLEPRCTGLITKIRDPLCLNFFLVVSYLDYAGSSDPKSCSWENLAPHHSILIRNFSICQYFGTPCIFTWPQNVAVTKDWRSKFSRNNSKNLARHQVHCCTRLSVKMRWDWWSRQRANDRYKDHLDEMGNWLLGTCMWLICISVAPSRSWARWKRTTGRKM